MSIQEKESLYEIGYKTALEFIPKRLSSADEVITEVEKMVVSPKL
jgi:NTE family protein